MEGELTIYLFGDQTFDVNAKLKQLIRDHKKPTLNSFLEQAYFTIRSEIGALSARERASYPRCTSVADLSSWDKQDVQRLPAIQSALTCVFQLAEFIKQHEGVGRRYPTAADACALGLCTGALSAAAVSSAASLSDLLPLAVETVAVAFRTGHVASTAGRCITAAVEPWSLVVAHLSAKAAAEKLDEFAEANHFSITSKPYISAHGYDSVTISGSPEVLEQLRNSSQFSNDRLMAISIHAPYHAKHLFNKDDIDEALRVSKASPQSSPAYLPVVSSTTGSLIDGADFPSRLRAALSQILIEPVRYQDLTEGIARFVKGRAPERFHTAAYSTTATPAIMSAVNRLVRQVSRPAESPTLPVHTSVPQDMHSNRSKIAIIGMSGRYPTAQDNQEFWNLLLNGLDVHKEAPALHWSTKTHVDTTGQRKNTSATPYGCWLEHPDLFDAQFFNMSPREAPQVDPAQRIALMTAYEAIEQAGIVPDATPSTRKDRVGVFYGVTSNDWMETNSAQNIDTYFIPGGNRAFIPGRINYFFKFSGPSYSVDTACSSSLAAVHIACNSLWRGDVDTAIAGGTNVLTNPDFTAGLDRGHFLSRTGNCKTFDDGADGYCRGEGVGTVILKRLEDAIADNDPIQALILGTYTNHSAEADSITRPHVGAQKAIFSKILNDAGVDPYTVSYVEMHGTGTQAGDAGEMASVLDTFAPALPERQLRQPNQSLYLGSAKANVGHGEAVSGVTALAKVLLMMQQSLVPPHCGIKTKINHKFPQDLKQRNVHIASKPTVWERSISQPRRAFVNNFSAAGGNSALLVEDKPAEEDIQGSDNRTYHIVAITAKNATSLSQNLISLLGHLENGGKGLRLGQLSYTTTARRMHHSHRVMISGSSLTEIEDRLQAAIDSKAGSTRPKCPPKVTFAFTGQGNQYIGMGRQLFQYYVVFRETVRRLDRLGQAHGFPSFTSYLIGEPNSGSGGDSPVTVQLASVSLQIALTRLWTSWGVEPNAVIGHSLGEYAALNAAGVLTDADTIYVVGKRAQLLEQQCTQGTHAMLAVKSSLSAVETALAGVPFELSCTNESANTVIGGSKEQIDRAKEILKKERLAATLIDVPYAYHTSQVEPILEEFELAMQGISFGQPTVPVVSTLLGIPIAEPGIFGPGYLRRHCRESVKFLEAVTSAKKTNTVPPKSVVIEIGPNAVLTRFVSSVLGSEATVFPTQQRQQDGWNTITDAIRQLYCAGKDLCWQEYHRDFEASQKVVQLPAYSWNLKSYWLQYVNDWSLRKGDPPTIIAAPSRLESSTVHTVLEEAAEKIIVESDICRADLNGLVQGHVVDHIPVCTPSVYADIALTIGRHCIQRYKPELLDCQMDVADMTIQKALVAKKEGCQPIRTFFDIDWAKQEALCRFATLNSKGDATVTHAKCTLRFTDQSQFAELCSNSEDIKSRMASMRKGIESGVTQRFNRTMVYKMIRPLAQFHEDYRALDEVIINSETLEASSKISLGGIQSEGTYHTHPAYIDALTQSGGFVMNCNDSNDLDIEVFVNHGWESFQIYQPIDPEGSYTTFIQMYEGDGRMFRGDLTVFDGEDVAACYKNICLQGVPRKVLRQILTFEAKNQAGIILTASHAATPQSTTSRTVSIVSPKAPVTKQATRAAPKDKDCPVVAHVQQSPQNSQLAEALKILSDESGIAASELNDDMEFANVGVDSLLSLNITSRLREELGLDVALDDFFTTCTTVQAFKAFFAAPNSDAPSGTVTPAETLTRSESPASASSTSSLDSANAKEAIRIVSDTSGISEDELTDDTVFAEIGIDSLLSLTIGSRLREELDMELELDEFFTRFTTVKDLKNSFISELEVPVSPPCEEPSVHEIRQDLSVDEPREEEVAHEVKDDEATPRFQDALAIISEESGVSLEELGDDCVLADVGVDSLLSLMIGGRLREELGVDIEMDAAFTDYPTIGHLRALFLPGSSGGSTASSDDPDSSEEGLRASPSSSLQTSNETSKCCTPEHRPVPPATSVVLQGSLRTARLTFFLFPDGAGSATSYCSIPNLAQDIAVVGLNSPYYKNPADFKCDLDELIESYLAEIRRRQPDGPYHFGGWSAGGILAYNATQKLIAAGVCVQHLVLIDSPVPKGLDKLPQHFYDFCNKHQLFGHATSSGRSSAPPEWLIPHFNATIDVLHDYFATALPRGRTPKTSIVWASQSVVDGKNVPRLPPHPDDTEGQKFLTETRINFSGNGWEKLLPGQVLRLEKIDANHFAMMRGEPADKLADFLRTSLT